MEATHYGRITFLSKVDESGVVELDESHWFGIESVRFPYSAMRGELEEGDRVKMIIKGGRKNPVVNAIVKV